MDVAGVVNAAYDETDLKVPNGMAMQLAVPAGGTLETRTETTNEYQMNYEQTHTTQQVRLTYKIEDSFTNLTLTIFF